MTHPTTPKMIDADKLEKWITKHRVLMDDMTAMVSIQDLMLQVYKGAFSPERERGDGWIEMEAQLPPKDGKHFLVVDMLNHGRPFVAVYFDSDFMECENGTWIEIESYTHWSPIAPLPTQGERE